MGPAITAADAEPAGSGERTAAPWRIAAAAGPVAAVAAVLWSMMLTPFTGAPQLGPAATAIVAGAAVLSLAVALSRGLPPARLMLLAIGVGLSVAAPTLSGLIHGGGPGFAPAALGLAASAAVLSAPVIGAAATRRGVLLVLAVIVWASLVVGAWALGHDGISALYERGDRRWIGVLQLSGIPGHPNGLAAYAGMALLLQLLAFRSLLALPRHWRIVALVAGPLASAAALVWSQSRTGLIMTTAAGAVLATVRVLGSRRIVVVCALALLAAASLLPPLLTLSGAQWTFHGRAFPWGIAWSTFRDNWLLGAGPEIFGPAFWEAWARSLPAWWEPAHAHNQALATAVLLGVVGLALLALTVAAMISIAGRAMFADQGWAIAVCALIFLYAGPENVLGVDDVAATYLSALLTAAVLGSSWAIAAASAGPDPSARSPLANEGTTAGSRGSRLG